MFCSEVPLFEYNVSTVLSLVDIYEYMGLKKKSCSLVHDKQIFLLDKQLLKLIFLRIWAKIQVRHLLNKSLTKAPFTPTKHGLKMENSNRKLEHRLPQLDNSNEVH